MTELPHVTHPRVRDNHHRYPFVFEVVPEEYVGSRGGRKIPVDIIWRQLGTGFFAKCFGCGCVALFPYVRYHNGKSEQLRMMFVKDWVEMTGKGSFRKPNKEEWAEIEARLQKCDEEKSKHGARMAEIVTSILKNGGTMSIRST